jgi:ParB family chromosome partitioning protein
MSKPETQLIDLRDIIVKPNRMRQLRPEVVDQVAASIASEGLLQPIVVRPDPKGVGFLLVAGWHRVEAKRKLKHETIECRVLDGLSADQARVAEIDENLIRADLTPSERAAHHAERKALYLKLHPETQQGGSREGAGRPKRDVKKAKSKGQNGPLKKDAYTKDAAKKTGKSCRIFHCSCDLIERTGRPALVVGTSRPRAFFPASRRSLLPDHNRWYVDRAGVMGFFNSIHALSLRLPQP